jgi:hypothetical protein
MFRQQIRLALLAGGIVAATGWTVCADDCCQPAPCAPTMRTVRVKEWVPEKYETTRTVYHTEQRQENYTAYRCETVQEQRTRTCIVNHYVPCQVEKCRTVCVKVPCVEERTTYKTVWKCVPETKCVRKCVDKGHYECKQVPCGPSCLDKLHNLCHHHNDCCEPCPQECAPRMKTVKCWVPCPTWEEHTCTVMKRVCERCPVTCKVNTCKTVTRQEKYMCTVNKCVPECKTVCETVCVQKRVPYQACRTVCVCVPCVERVTCCRMVCHEVEKQVPCPAPAPCAAPCATSCCQPSPCHSHGHRCGCGHKLFHHSHDCGGCGGGCGGCGGCS